MLSPKRGFFAHSARTVFLLHHHRKNVISHSLVVSGFFGPQFLKDQLFTVLHVNQTLVKSRARSREFESVPTGNEPDLDTDHLPFLVDRSIAFLLRHEESTTSGLVSKQ